MNARRYVCLLVIALFSTSIFGADESSTKDKRKNPPEHQRGWIGGEYKLARRRWSWSDTTDAVVAFPKSLTNAHQGILITGLSTNTPLYLGGLREADLILELDHQRIGGISEFRRRIDQAKPGASLAVQFYRHGELQDCAVMVGRETFREHGALAIGVPLGVPRPNLRFNPSFSLVALGLSWKSNKRTELDSPEETFRRENEKEHHPSDGYWDAWAGPIFVSRYREICSQEIINP